MEMYTLWGSVGYFIASIVVLFIALQACDIGESGTLATVVFIGFLVANYFAGDMPIFEYITWQSVLIYLGLGIVFSVIRTIAKGKELTKCFETDSNHPEGMSKRDKDTLKIYKKRYELKERVFRWLFLFPFSAITWLFGTLFVDAWNYLYSKFGHFYEKLLNV
jgi:hypothetical protein